MMRMNEERALLLIHPHLQARCYRRWYALEYEDRIAETQIAFLHCWRTLEVNTGHFLRDLDAMLEEYMKQAARAYGTRYSGACSLDAALATKDGRDSCTGYTFCAAPPQDESKLYVNMFLNSLPHDTSQMVRDLLAGYSRAEIARRHHVSPYQLNRLLYTVGTRYKEEYGEA